MFARDILDPDFISLKGDVSALEAAREMKDRRHGFVIVMSPDSKPEGIVTEWDLLSKITAEGKDPSNVLLRDVMSTGLITVRESDGVDEVAKLMAEREIRRVLVMRDGKIVGIITAKQILARLEDYINTISTQIARLHTQAF